MSVSVISQGLMQKNGARWVIPSARVFEVFLIVLDGVQGGDSLGGENPARATTLIVSQSAYSNSK